MRQVKRLGRPKNHVPISYMKFRNDDGTISIYNYDKKAEKRFQLVKTITNEKNEISTLEMQSVQEFSQTPNIAFQSNSQNCQVINTQYFEPDYSQGINGESFELQPCLPDDVPIVFNDDSNLCSNYGSYNAFDENANACQTQTIAEITTDYEQNENNDAFVELGNLSYEMFDFGTSSNFAPNILDTNENNDINNFSLDDFDFSF